MSTDLNDLPFDPNLRRLCPDGTCVGVIGQEGKCRICGAVDPEGPPAARQDEGASPVEEPEPMASATPIDGDDFDPNRRLCADDSCIGILDESGRCKVCGRMA